MTAEVEDSHRCDIETSQGHSLMIDIPIDHYHWETLGAIGDLLIIQNCQKNNLNMNMLVFLGGSPMILRGFLFFVIPFGVLFVLSQLSTPLDRWFFVYHAGLGSIALWPGTIRVQWREEGKDCGGPGGMAFESTLRLDII